MRGLLGRSGLEPDRALLLERARSVHTVRMSFTITVAFLDDDLRVLDVVSAAPGRMLLPRRRARSVLELEATEDVRVGDPLQIEGAESRSAEQRTEQEEHDHRGDDERGDGESNHGAGPGGERHGLATRRVGLDDPEELQQRPHVLHPCVSHQSAGGSDP